MQKHPSAIQVNSKGFRKIGSPRNTLITTGLPRTCHRRRGNRNYRNVGNAKVRACATNGGICSACNFYAVIACYRQGVRHQILKSAIAGGTFAHYGVYATGFEQFNFYRLGKVIVPRNGLGSAYFPRSSGIRRSNVNVGRFGNGKIVGEIGNGSICGVRNFNLIISAGSQVGG